MIQTKSTSFLSFLAISSLLLGTSSNINAIEKKTIATVLLSTGIILTINEIWSTLAARSGSGDIKKRTDKAAIARKVIKELWPKWKNGSITKEEYQILKIAIWHIIDAEWIGYYKTPKNRIAVTFKTSDGRAVVIDAMEKSNGSVGLGKVFQRIMGFADFEKLITSTITLACGVALLDQYFTNGSLAELLKSCLDLKSNGKNILRNK